MSDLATGPAKAHWLDSWHVDPSVNREYDFIDGLRGLAILMVLLCHSMYVSPKSGPAMQFIGGLFIAGGGGVVLFFALSGFLISWPFWKRKFAGQPAIPPGYARRRFWKIYPPLALSLIIFTPVYVILDGDRSCIAIAARWLAALPFFRPVDGRFNPAMWTLVVEVQFYLTLPLVFAVARAVPRRAALYLIPAIFLAIPMVYRALTGLHPAYHPDINAHYPSALDNFAFGILIAGLDCYGILKPKWAKLAVLGLGLWLIAIVLSARVWVHLGAQPFFEREGVGWLEKIGSGLLLLYVANPKSALPVLFEAAWLRWCGIISYEWYLFHQPIIFWIRGRLSPAGGNLLQYAALVGWPLAVGLILAAVIYRYFSLPILKFGRRRKPASARLTS